MKMKRLRLLKDWEQSDEEQIDSEDEEDDADNDSDDTTGENQGQSI